jgi:hypothetical protein
MNGQPWAVELGYCRLSHFQRTVGDRQFRFRRQAEMSEYNSLTYTALDLWFLALIAEFAEHKEARALALFLEHRLWVDVAMHFHAPSHQFAGPHLLRTRWSPSFHFTFRKKHAGLPGESLSPITSG